MHPFAEVADLRGGHPFASDHPAEPELGGFASLLGLLDPAGDGATAEKGPACSVASREELSKDPNIRKVLWAGRVALTKSGAFGALEGTLRPG